jgi:hypothetical protein
MKQKIRIVLLLTILQNSGALCQNIFEKINQTSSSSSMLYYYIDPKIVYRGDESTKLTIEVATNGATVSRVYIVSPIQTDLYDDGTHGDRIAGDGIYTINEVSHNTTSTPLKFGGTHVTRGHFNLKIEKKDATIEEHWLSIGVVSQEQQFPVKKVGDGLYATEYAFFIVDRTGETFGVTDWPLGKIRCGKEYFGSTQKLYSVFPDMFDFVIVMPAHTIYDPQTYSENVPYFIRAKNEIKNIGIEQFDNTVQFGSSGRLMGMIYHSWDYGSILDHEIGHAWCADIGRSLSLCWTEKSSGNHWNPYSDISGQMSAYLFNTNVQYGAGNLKSNGDGTWRIERDLDDNRLYSNLDLYAMGLLPPEEVSPIHILVNPDATDYQHVTAERVDTYNIEDIINAEGGKRSPAYGKTPKEFNIAFIAVKNKEFTPAEFAFYSLVSKYFASEAQGELSLTTFYTATGGRGKLNPHLPVETAIQHHEHQVKDFTLFQNYPNPFNNSTMINYQLPIDGMAKLSIYNITGQEIIKLDDGFQSIGMKSVTWNGLDNQGKKVTSGLYFYQLEAVGFTAFKKMIIVQ